MIKRKSKRGSSVGCSSSATSIWDAKTIEFDATILDNFVAILLEEGAGNHNDINESNESPFAARDLSRALSEHYISQGGKLCNFRQQQKCEYCSHEHLEKMVYYLQSCIQSNPSLAPDVAAEAHSFIGLLQQKQGLFPEAIQSFLKALWIISSSSSSVEVKPSWKLAASKHRLGVAYGRNSQFDDAILLLESAQKEYEDAQGTGFSPITDEVAIALNSFREAKRLEFYVATTTGRPIASQHRASLVPGGNKRIRRNRSLNEHPSNTVAAIRRRVSVN